MRFSRVNSVWFALIAVVVGGMIVAVRGQSTGGQLREGGPGSREPVLVELFTSEGCSDCPPADALLAKLDATQSIPGAQVIVLSEHVTYWNHLGWRDPFSFEAMDERQQRYVTQFSLEGSYTPQAVVDGAAQVVGNNATAVSRAVGQAALTAKQKIALENARWVDGDVEFSVRSVAAPGETLFAVLAEDATHSEVARGENAGRTLHHVAVVRTLKEFGANAADGRSLRVSGGELSQRSKGVGPVRLVVFMVDRRTGHIAAVAEEKLNR
jgi:hypothetical protein